jgi:hypothetical protein
MVRAASLAPLAFGVKVTLTLQLAPTGRLVGQLLTLAKSVKFCPPREMFVMWSASVPRLNDTRCGELLVPTF